VTVRRSRRRWRLWLAVLLTAVLVLAAALVLTYPLWTDLLWQVTGENTLPAQIRGGLEWLGNITRPRPKTADQVPVANAGVQPFGINVFLQEEVEPQKRERAIQMIAEAGFHWIRQEFPWEDIEIHGKGDFEDRRHDPYRSAWEKYDHIVELAEQYDLEIIARLSNPPAWSRAQGNEAGPLAPPDNLDDYGDFVETVVRRYQGRIHTYQIWNEPNIYPEWGERPASPEEYTELLKVGYTRVKATCPDCVVLSGALAQTIPLGPRDLTDLIFLQRMYDAGAGDYFDVLAMQGYGLWSGPTDRRMRPRVLNFSRPLYLREIMVQNGDAHKPIWITEMNWNAPPTDLPNKQFGYVTPEQQAHYAVEAFRRMQDEWPWVGVVNIWFFKRATDAEVDQAMYYFRLVEPDFTPLPIYDALKAYFHSEEARTLYPGVHQEDHWALDYEGSWQTVADPVAQLGRYRSSDDDQASLSFAFEGTDLVLQAGPGAAGTFSFRLDGEEWQSASYASGQEVLLARGLPPRRHTVDLVPGSGGELSVDGFAVDDRRSPRPWLVAVGSVALAVLLVGAFILAVRRRRPWYERSRAG
jgi:hypothetical protein